MQCILYSYNKKLFDYMNSGAWKVIFESSFTGENLHSTSPNNYQFPIAHQLLVGFMTFTSPCGEYSWLDIVYKLLKQYFKEIQTSLEWY